MFGQMTIKEKVLSALAVITLLVAVAGVLSLARDFAVHEASKTEIAVARSAAHQIDRSYRTSRLVLSGMAVHMKAAAGARAGAIAAVEAMSERLAYETVLTAASVHDARGTTLAATPSDRSVPSLRAADITAAAGDSQYGIGTPRHDAASGRWVWPIVRLIDMPGHAQPAYAAVWIDIDRLRAEIAGAADLDRRSLLVVRGDGIALFRVPRPEKDPAAADLSSHPVFSRIVAGDSYGAYSGPSPIDRVRRVAGFAQAPESGLIAVNSRREIDILAEQLGNGVGIAVMLGSGLVFVVAGGLGLALWRMRTRADRSERESILGSLALADASIAIADPKTQCLVYVNPAFERMTGYSAAEAIGKNCRFLQGPATDAATVARMRESLAQGRPVRADVLNYRKDGQPFWFDLSIGPILTPDGGLKGFVAAGFDITERVRMASELKDALARAHAADRAKSAFLARMSHELRTPLNAIIGFSEAMRLRVMGALPERYAEYAGDIHDSGRHLLALVERILEMARLEAGGRVLAAEPIDLAGIARDAATLSRAAIDRAAAHLVLEFDGPATALGDPTALRQIAVNLVSNAARHGKKGGTILVRASAAGGRARLEGTDDGPGIAPDLIEKLGTPFLTRRADTADGEGVGLGLAISMELAKRMGGTLEIVNANPGTRATLDLPIAAAARNAA